MMNVTAVKFLNRNGAKAFRSATHIFVRMASTDEPCPPKQPDSSKPKEPCPTPSSTCPSPPPCPPMPQCPPTICPPVLDSNNPCNYCPPPCPDPGSPSLTRLKKLQCLFQEDNDIPVHIKRGNADAFFVQTTYVLNILGLLLSFYSIYQLLPK